MKRLLALLLVFATLTALISGCASEKDSTYVPTGDAILMEDDPDPTEEDTLADQTMILAYYPNRSMNPIIGMNFSNRVLFSLMYQGLFAYNSSNETTPILCSRYRVNSNNTIYTFYVDDNARFSDGTRVTPNDVLASYQAAQQSDFYKGRFTHIAEIKLHDDGQGVMFYLDTSYQNLPLLLDIPIIKSGTKDEASPPGTGPYEFAETKLTRCKNWWRDTPPLVDFDEIALTVSSTAADVRDNFEYQKVNMVLTDPNSSAFAGFHNDFELWNEETTIMQYIGYNMNSPVFSNYGLRGAITFAIDREQLVGQTLGGFAVASTLPCSPNSRYYDVKLANNFAYDTGSYYDQLASASVEDATGDGILDLYVPSKGYSVPVEGTMIVCSSSYIRVQAANEVARMLNSLGFNITVKSMEYSEYKQALLQGNFDLYYGEVRLSPNFDLSPFFGATGTLNYGDLADSTMMNLCSMALVNSGNTYNLYKRVCERGYITPILFKSYALYTTRGAVTEPTRYLDWFLPYTVQTEE